MRTAELPAPEPQALAASRALLERIGAELAAAGNWISFARYMELALHEPGLGYYAARRAQVRRGRRFRHRARTLAAVRPHARAPGRADRCSPGDAILEFGAGTGALAAV